MIVREPLSSSFRAAPKKRFDYIVVGDATTVEGLAAPYDEEDTRFLLKIERPSPGTNIFEFWFEHGNLDLYSGKTVETQELERVSPPPVIPPKE